MTKDNRSFSFEQQVRKIFREELQKFFAGSSDTGEESIVDDDDEEESIALAPLVAAKRARTAKGNRGRVTNPKDGRLRANKK